MAPSKRDSFFIINIRRLFGFISNAWYHPGFSTHPLAHRLSTRQHCTTHATEIPPLPPFVQPGPYRHGCSLPPTRSARPWAWDCAVAHTSSAQAMLIWSYIMPMIDMVSVNLQVERDHSPLPDVEAD